MCGFDGADGFGCLPAAAGGHVLASCEVADDCAPGLLCAPAERAPAWCQAGAEKCCLPACSLEVQVCNVAELTCVPYFEGGAAPPGYEHVGVCGAP